MDYDKDKVDEMVLALLFLTSSTDKHGTRAWKGLNSEAMERLHVNGYIGDPRGRGPTVSLSEEGALLSQKLFRQHFANRD